MKKALHKKSLKDRFLNNWFSTALGILIIILSGFMWYQGKTDATGFSIGAIVGCGIAGIKYKNLLNAYNGSENNNQQSNSDQAGI